MVGVLSLNYKTSDLEAHDLNTNSSFDTTRSYYSADVIGQMNAPLNERFGFLIGLPFGIPQTLALPTLGGYLRFSNFSMGYGFNYVLKLPKKERFTQIVKMRYDFPMWAVELMAFDVYFSDQDCIGGPACNQNWEINSKVPHAALRLEKSVDHKNNFIGLKFLLSKQGWGSSIDFGF